MGWLEYGPDSPWGRSVQGQRPGFLYGWDPSTPRSGLPRKVKDALGNLGTILVGSPVIGLTPQGNPLVPGQRTVNSTGASSVAVGGDGAGLHYRRIRRNGSGSKDRWFDEWGPMPFHHIVDPTQGKAGVSVILSDLIVPTFDSGNAWVFFGIGGLNVATDETSWSGVVWKTNNVDLCWTSGLYSGTGAPSTTVHETKQSSLSFNATGVGQAHRLSIVLDADAKKIEWYANGVLMDSYTLSSALGQFANCPHLLYYGITAAGADCSIYCQGGGNPRMLTLVPID